ncbi:fibronectin type III domain-containing protein [Sphingobacterium phlebotomi]|uniref:Fibronectin type III domain-containing protein n=1 Tax=Sphingobacterium phlebotomi TaxID=2605433 RepID=A0A5D4H736_9SPHI|nr:fibronectin type III domain-containing protein [Sphingobacterium phlebotomi]TYR36344.1 fibronectin type III domain-containing protein [Sphingobacterium phlebotomi]
MRKATVYLAYEKWDDYSLSTLAGRTLAAMTDNENFPDPRPAVDAYALLVNDYREKHEVASNGGSRLEREAKDNAKKALALAMKEMAFYVNMLADGNREMLASSGFELVSGPTARKIPGIPRDIRLLDGNVSGEMRLVFGSLRTAWEYEYSYTTLLDGDGTPDWGEIIRTTNSRLNYINGLTPGERVYARVRARNNKGAGDWSEPVSLITR